MGNKLMYLVFVLVLFSCTSEVKETKENTFVPPEKEEVVKYYANGKIRTKGMLYNGERHGKWSYFYDNGFLWSEGVFFYGKRDGFSNLFYRNGKKMISGNYKDNKAVDDWHFYSEEGELIKTIDADENPAELEKQMKEFAQLIAN